MAMIACTPCLLAPVKTGAAVLAGALGITKLKNASKKKKRRNKKTQRGGKKKTSNRRKTRKNQKGGSGMVETYDEAFEDNERLFEEMRQLSNEERELQRDCRKHLRDGIREYQRKYLFDKYKAREANTIKVNCDRNKSNCGPCIEFKEKAYANPGFSLLHPPHRPEPPLASQPWRPKTRSQLGESRSMRFRAADNTNFVKKMESAKRSKHLRDALDRRKHRKNRIRKLRKTRSASFGGGRKTKRRTRKLKR